MKPRSVTHRRNQPIKANYLEELAKVNADVDILETDLMSPEKASSKQNLVAYDGKHVLNRRAF